LSEAGALVAGAAAPLLLVWVVLGVVWALPLKAIFKGVGQPDPAAQDDPPRD